jgi:hypothetical protein
MPSGHQVPRSYHVRRVGACGTVRWHVAKIFVGNALIGEPIGLLQLDEDRWHFSCGPVVLAIWNARRERRQKL